MVKIYIENAIKDITKLIELTKEDLADIAKANHKAIANRVSQKNHLTVSFETNKSLLNDELTNKAQLNNLEISLSSEEKKLLEELKTKLSKLKDENRKYAKYIIKLNEFYTSLFDEMFKLDRRGYEVTYAKPAQVFAVSA